MTICYRSEPEFLDRLLEIRKRSRGRELVPDCLGKPLLSVRKGHAVTGRAEYPNEKPGFQFLVGHCAVERGPDER